MSMMKKLRIFQEVFICCLLVAGALLLPSCAAPVQFTVCKTKPTDFIEVCSVIPDIQVDMRYAGSNNFTGRPVTGYEKPVAILTGTAANALKKVQDDLRPFGLSLKIYDAYRPQSAVDDFCRWSRTPGEQTGKAQYYPDIDKSRLFTEGYIMEHSAHSRGSAVDLTITCRTPDGQFRELDMGGGFDLFSVRSWPDCPDITPQQRANRLLLRSVMMKHGFLPYPKEWWHFSPENESWPETYFDFPVR